MNPDFIILGAHDYGKTTIVMEIVQAINEIVVINPTIDTPKEEFKIMPPLIQRTDLIEYKEELNYITGKPYIKRKFKKR